MKKYVARRDIARALGILSSTIGAWDRHRRGPGKPIYISSRFVVYAEDEVREFFRERGVYEPVWVALPKRAAARSAATPSPQEHEAGPESRAAATSPVLEARSGLVRGHEDESAPTVAAERTEEP